MELFNLLFVMYIHQKCEIEYSFVYNIIQSGLSIPQELREDKNVMDKTWDRNPLKSEVIGQKI